MGKLLSVLFTPCNRVIPAVVDVSVMYFISDSVEFDNEIGSENGSVNELLIRCLRRN